MVPERFKHYLFNDNDYLPEHYEVADKEREELIRNLAAMITDDLGMSGNPKKISNDEPDFWLLDKLLTTDEVRFMLSFKKKRVVKLTAAEMAERNKMSVDAAVEMAEGICRKGLLEYDRENDAHEKQYFVPKWVVGSGEYMLMTSKVVEEHPEVATFFHYASMVPVGKVAHMVPEGGGGLGMHVIPVEKAIEANNKSISYEKLSYWLKKYDKYCLDVCSCRRQQRVRGEGGGEIEDYWCIAVGDMAEYLVETHKDARYATYEEVMSVLERAEKAGYVHQITNLDGEDKIVGICNCHNTVCNALKTSQLFNTPNMSASAYRAHVDHNKCVACGKCVEVCPAGAAKLGQKLHRADHSEVKYPVHDLPDDHIWGEDRWDPDYRDHNVINTHKTGTSPCKSACPAHLAVQGYVKMAALGRYEDALKLIRQDNPFPAVCGAVCNKRCEDACTRGLVDNPVSIDEIKKFLAYRELDNGLAYLPVCENDEGKQWDDYKVAVIGAGPAGLMAARTCAQKGFDVTVFEKNDKVGGQILLAAAPAQKKKIGWITEDYKTQCDLLGVKFELGTEATVENIKALQPYAIFNCTGGVPLVPNIPGKDLPNVYTPDQILGGEVKLSGKKVAVIGSGMTGLETAEYLLEDNDIIVVEMADELAPGTWIQHKMDVIPKLEDAGSKLLPGWKLVEIREDSVEVEDVNVPGRFKNVPCDVVIMSLGVRPTGLDDSIKALATKVISVGDAEKSGRIADATHGAYEAAVALA